VTAASDGTTRTCDGHLDEGEKMRRLEHSNFASEYQECDVVAAETWAIAFDEADIRADLDEGEFDLLESEDEMD